MGIETIGALQRMPEAELAERFGARHGRELHARAWFHDDSPVTTDRVLKSRSNERTFDEDIASLAELEEILRRLARELCEGLAARGKRGRTIGIKVRLDDWTNVTRARTIDVADLRRRRSSRTSPWSCCAPTRRRDRCGCWACGWRRSRTTRAAAATAQPVALDQLALPLG